MKMLFLRWLSLTAAILVASYLLDGIHISGFFSALCAAAMLGIFNAVLRPVALILTLPINMLTLGLFTFFINAALLKMVSAIVRGFDVAGFGTALIGSLVISLVSWMLNTFLREHPPAPPSRKSPLNGDIIDLAEKGKNRWE